jgi:hypothetical protein
MKRKPADFSWSVTDYLTGVQRTGNKPVMCVCVCACERNDAADVPTKRGEQKTANKWIFHSTVFINVSSKITSLSVASICGGFCLVLYKAKHRDEKKTATLLTLLQNGSKGKERLKAHRVASCPPKTGKLWHSFSPIRRSRCAHNCDDVLPAFNDEDVFFFFFLDVPCRKKNNRHKKRWHKRNNSLSNSASTAATVIEETGEMGKVSFQKSQR